MSAAAAKVKPKKANKVEVVQVPRKRLQVLSRTLLHATPSRRQILSVQGRAPEKERRVSRKRDVNSAFRSSEQTAKREQVDAGVALALFRWKVRLQKYDEAVKRFNDQKAQGKGKTTPKGGVGVAASMIVLDLEDEAETSVSCAAVKCQRTTMP